MIVIEDSDAMRTLTTNQRQRGDTSTRIVSLFSPALPFVRRPCEAKDG